MLKAPLILVLLGLLPSLEAFAPQRKTSKATATASLSTTTTQRFSTETDTASTFPAELDDKQLDFCKGYLNKHESDVLLAFAESFSELGKIKAKKNGFSGGSFALQDAKLITINQQEMELEVTVQERGKNPRLERVPIPLDATPVTKLRTPHADMAPIPRDWVMHPVDNVVRRLNRLCWMVNKPETSGRLIQMGIQIGGQGVGKIKENLYLNQVPHNRYVRKYFYEMCADAVMEAVVLCSERKITNRMKVVAMFPEMNPSMDSYRIGTILELVRTVAIKLCEQNLRVRVCVQGSMGVGIFTGVPKQLNGVSRLLEMMDWQSEEGEENEGMVGNYLNFGAVGKEHVVNEHTKEDGTKVEQDDVFIIIAPQSMVGIDTSIMGLLSEMVEAAGDRPVILVNPDLTDKVSSQGQQSVRGRKERIEFADSFQSIYHFQNIYVSGTSYFPILGSMTKLSPLAPWVAHQRRDLVGNQGEVYVPVLASEVKPSGEEVLEAFEN